MSSQPIVSARGLSIGWGSTALMQDLEFEIQRGDVFVILGGSGTGKTTLLRALIGLETPLAGTVHIDGVGAPNLAAGAPRYGVLFQSGALFGSMTLQENISLPLQKWTTLPDEAIEAVALARLRLVGLGGFENHLPAEISGGMKKRAGIARALALDPELLFLDEPSAGLDPISAVELDDLILALGKSLGVTTVLVTHELESIYRIASTCIMLDKDTKGIIARGDPRELRDGSEDPRVQRFFRRQSRAS